MALVSHDPVDALGLQQLRRRALLRRLGGLALGTTTLSAMVACGSTAPASTAAPTSPALSTSTAVAPPTATASTVLVPTASSSIKPTTAPAGAAATPLGTLRYANADFVTESVDPIVFEPWWGWAMYDSLLTVDAQGNTVGNVAETYDLSADGLTWTFNIRQGIKFWNGDPLTAADVVFSIERFGSKESTNPWSPYILKNSVSVTAQNDYTVVYQAQKPEWPLKVPFSWVRILPKNYFMQVGQDGFRAQPMGSGPYKFVKWVPKTSIEFEANTGYWGPRPQWARIIETLVPEEATRVAQLERGEADMIGNLSSDRLMELKSKGYRLQQAGLPSAANINFPGTWLTSGPTSDVRVRQALSYAINRQEMCDTFYKGLAKPGGWWFFSEQTWAFDSSFKPDPYEPNRARQLLQEAGYPDKFTPKTITIYTTAVAADLMQALQGYWQKVGVETDIQVVDTKVYQGLVFVRVKDAGDKQVGAIWPWVGPVVDNNVYQAANMFTSTGVLSTSNDPRADQLYQAAVAERDESKAKKLFQDFLHYGYDSLWVNVGLVNVPTYFVVGPNVGEFTGRVNRNIWDSYLGIRHALG